LLQESFRRGCLLTEENKNKDTSVLLASDSTGSEGILDYILAIALV